MKKKRILVLVHESLVPPDNPEGFSELEVLEWKTEYDVIVTLKEMGHEVDVIGLSSDVDVLLNTIQTFRPDICFNLLEEFHQVPTYDQHVVSLMELLKQPYTGCNPQGLMLAHDKSISKQILAHQGVQTPCFITVPMGKKIPRPVPLNYPLFVKSSTEDASLGISQASVVHDQKQLVKRVEFIHSSTQSGALIEEYIDGRELYVGVLGNNNVETFPIWELDFSNMPSHAYRIATRKVKWDPKYQKKNGIITAAATDISRNLKQEIERCSKLSYRVLHMSGYARMDFRLTHKGEVFLLEANPNPNLSYGEDLAESAEMIGINYEALLSRIIDLGLCYEAAWKQTEVDY